MTEDQFILGTTFLLVGLLAGLLYPQVRIRILQAQVRKAAAEKSTEILKQTAQGVGDLTGLSLFGSF